MYFNNVSLSYVLNPIIRLLIISAMFSRYNRIVTLCTMKLLNISGIVLFLGRID